LGINTHTHKSYYSLIFYIILIASLPAQTYANTDYESCLLKSFSLALPGQTMEEIKSGCKDKDSPLTNPKEIVVEIPTENNSGTEKRQLVESIAEDLPFLLVPHNKNYVLPITYNQSPNQEPFQDDALKLDRAEVKFQFSIKSRLISDVFGEDGDLWFGYTNLSFWQAYNTSNSSFFRETNHEPELFMDFHPDISIGSWKSSLLRLGATHQSNGRSDSRSRSWNRLYALATIEKDEWYFSVKPWYRIPESNKDDPEDTRGDDNPDIDKFVGYGDLTAMYHADEHTYGMTFRNNLRDRNRFGMELNWTFPLKDKLRGYVQLYSGYGESLIDYDASVNRIGVGVMFSDIL
jgi:phospholipase A1